MKMKYMVRGAVDLTYGKDYEVGPDEFGPGYYSLVDDDGCYRSRPVEEFIPATEQPAHRPTRLEDVRVGSVLVAGTRDGADPPRMKAGEEHTVIEIVREHRTPKFIVSNHPANPIHPYWFGLTDADGKPYPEDLPDPPRFAKDIKAGDWLIAGDKDGSCHPDLTLGQRYEVLAVAACSILPKVRIKDQTGVWWWGLAWFGYKDGEYVGTPQHRKEAGPAPAEQPAIRTFTTGATRNPDHNKIDYEGFLSPWALHAFGEYMHGKRVQADGTLRDSDNWQRGIPLDSYMKSMWRHLMDVWMIHRGGEPVQPETGKPVELVEALCALMFNVQGYLHETLKEEERE